MADIYGTTGDDSLDGTPGDDNMVGGPSNDPSSDTGSDTLSGGSGNDQINGVAGDDFLSGGDGDDQLRGGTGNDSLNLGPGGHGYSSGQGDAGDDVITVGESLDGGYAEGYGGDGNDTILGSDAFDRFVGENGDDVLWGAGGSDDLRGGAGNDIVSGGEGNDGLQGGTGDDEIDGGAGDDYITFADPLDRYTVSSHDGVVTVRNALGTSHVTSGESFQFGDVTYAVDDIVCFLAGTLIDTPGGAVPIEQLAIGDQVATSEGPRPVRWIGHRAYAAAFARRNRAVWPVRIAAGALAAGVPRRDLMVSAQHALFVDGVMVEAQFLENGASIARIEPATTLAYYNIELERHGVILAEGLPVESFLDRDCRHLFQNAASFAALYPDAVVDPRPAAERVEDGPVLAALRRRVDARAGLVAAVAAPGMLLGGIDRADRRGITGWVLDTARPGEPVTVEILVDDIPLGRVVANRRRPDLTALGDGRGLHGFDCPWTLDPAQRHAVTLRRAEDGCDLPCSPLLLEAAASAAMLAGALAAATAGLAGAPPAALDAAIEALLGGIDQLLGASATGDGEAWRQRFVAPPSRAA